jgi:hypothetical protein
VDADDQGNIREPVGYANPPVHSRFQPGQSGNLAGRTKGRSLTAIVREVLESNTLGGKPIPQGRTVKEVLGDVIVKEALKGKFTFTKEVWDRTEGKVPDKVQHSGEGGGPVEFNAVVSAPAGSELESWRRQQREKLESTMRPDEGRSNT